MTITESQRRTLDLMAESAGWGWADVETLSQDLFREDVAGLSAGQARRLMAVIAEYQAESGEMMYFTLGGDDAQAR